MDAQLKEKKIPFIIRSYHDSAYDGVFQFQKGWGRLDSDEAHREDIEAIYRDVIESAGDDDAIPEE